MHCESRDFLPEGLLLESRNFHISVHHRIERNKLLNWPLDDLQRRPLLSRCWRASAIKRVTGRNHHFMGTRPSSTNIDPAFASGAEHSSNCCAAVSCHLRNLRMPHPVFKTCMEPKKSPRRFSFLRPAS
jgi:hypothetical protein